MLPKQLGVRSSLEYFVATTLIIFDYSKPRGIGEEKNRRLAENVGSTSLPVMTVPFGTRLWAKERGRAAEVLHNTDRIDSSRSSTRVNLIMNMESALKHC